MVILLSFLHFRMSSSPKMAAATQMNTFLSLPDMIPNILAQH